MKKGYYLYDGCLFNNDNGDKTYYDGVEKKINFQLAEFRKNFIVQKIPMKKPNFIQAKIVKRMPFVGMKLGYDALLVQMQQPDFIYIRRVVIDKEFLNFLGAVKEVYPLCKIVLEIPTYPYDIEQFIGKPVFWKNFLIYFKDKYNRERLHNYVDRIVVYTDDKCIWNIKTIQTSNGVDVQAIQPKVESCNHQEINLLSVATMIRQHGYDRVIEGLKNYYNSNPERKVFYHVVGNGPEKEKYQKLVEQSGLRDKVIFYGEKKGEELDHIYNKADITIAALGMHRVGLTSQSTLKTREYLAKGLPFIYSGEIDVFKGKEVDFAKQFPADDSPIDIQKVIDFYDSLREKYTGSILIDTIRKFAEETVSMEKVMEPIITYILQ